TIGGEVGDFVSALAMCPSSIGKPGIYGRLASSQIAVGGVGFGKNGSGDEKQLYRSSADCCMMASKGPRSGAKRTLLSKESLTVQVAWALRSVPVVACAARNLTYS